MRSFPYRGPDGTLYLDNLGSYLVREIEGEMEIDIFAGTRVVFQRGWKRDGRNPPRTETPVVPTTAVESMKKLLDTGAISQEQYDAKVAELLERV